MKQIQKLRFTGVGVAAVSLVALSIVLGISGFARTAPKASNTTLQSAKPEYIQAEAEGTSTQMGQMANVTIMINEYSNEDEHKGLVEAFDQKGSKGLYNALNKMHSKGRIAITGTLGYDISYVRQFPLPDGGRKIRLITNRPISFGEAWASSNSMDYNLSACEIILSSVKGKSTGTLYPAMELKLNKEAGLEIETYQNPWKMANIMQR